MMKSWRVISGSFWKRNDKRRMDRKVELRDEILEMHDDLLDGGLGLFCSFVVIIIPKRYLELTR